MERICQICNLPFSNSSLGGYYICSACDCGVNRDGTKWNPTQVSKWLRRQPIGEKTETFRPSSKVQMIKTIKETLLENDTNDVLGPDWAEDLAKAIFEKIKNKMKNTPLNTPPYRPWSRLSK